MRELFNNQGSNYAMREPIQIDEEGLYFGSLVKEYKHRYMRAGDWTRKPRFSHWNKRTGHEFIRYFKNKGVEITIFNTSSRKAQTGEKE